MGKDNRIDIRLSTEDKNKIEKNAAVCGLAVGAYLRLLGLAGLNPFGLERAATRPSKRYQSYEVKGDDVHIDEPKQRKVSPPPSRRERAA